MREESNTEPSKPCRRCQRRCQSTRRARLCERCERAYLDRRKSVALSFWKGLGYLLIVPLIVLTWNTKSPLGDSLPGLVFGHLWLVILGVFAGQYLSRKLSEGRLLLLRHRFEQEEQNQAKAIHMPHPHQSQSTLTKGLYEV